MLRKLIIGCVLLSSVVDVNALPLIATPADNSNLRRDINIAGAGIIGGVVTDIFAPPALNFFTSNITMAQGVAIKAIPPVFSPPAPLFLTPDDDGDNDSCHFSYTNQRVTSRYKNLFFMQLDPLPGRPHDWGIFGRGPTVYHNTADVAVRLSGLGDGDLTGIFSETSKFASGSLPEGSHPLRWEAATQFSATMDVAIPFALNVLFNKIRYSSHSKKLAEVAAKSSKGGAQQASNEAAKGAAKSDLLEAALQEMMEDIGLAIGGEIGNEIGNARASDPNGRFSIYELLAVDSAINRPAPQSLTIYDQHAPFFRDALSFQRIASQDIVLEATDFGGARFSRVRDELAGRFQTIDGCGRDLSLSALNAPSLLVIQDEGEPPHNLVWNIQDAGPYDHSAWGAGRLGAGQELFGDEGLRTRLTQRIVVQDTTAPLLLPPPGFARLESGPVLLDDIDLGRARVIDRADPRPLVTHQITPAPVGGALALDRRYFIEYTATDAFGNATAAPAEDPDKYTQVVTLKSSNTPPEIPASMNDLDVTTRTSEAVEVQLTGFDADVIDNVRDPLEFKVARRPDQGEFEIPGLPYFIEDFRLQPDVIPENETADTLDCPTDAEKDLHPLEHGPILESKLAQLDSNEHGQYIRRCYCEGYRGNHPEAGFNSVPITFAYKPKYVHVSDTGEHYLMDLKWRCNVNDPEISNRISKWRDRTFLAHREIGGVLPEHFSIDESNHVVSYFTSTGQPGEQRPTLNYLTDNLELAPNGNFTIIDSQAPLNAGSIRAMYPAIDQGVIYVTDGFAVAMYDYFSEEFLGLLQRPEGGPLRLRNSGSCGGGEAGWGSARGYHFQTDSHGDVYLSEHCEDRIHKFQAPVIDPDTGTKRPGDYIGWLGRCSGNLSDPDGRPYFDCNEAAQTSFGYQCRDDTCARVRDPGVFEGLPGSAPGQFNSPGHINMDPNDILYVADYNNLRVQRFGPDGTFAGEAISAGAGIENDGNFVLGNMGQPRNVSVNSKAFHVLTWSFSNDDFFLHVYKTLPFYDITRDSAKIKYVSKFGFQGNDTFEILVSDGIAESAPATVNVTVNRAFRAPDQLQATCYPDAGFDPGAAGACTTAEDQPLFLELTARDLDGILPFGLDAVHFHVVEPTSHGQLTVLETREDRTRLRYTPEPNFNGGDRFSFRASNQADPDAGPWSEATPEIALEITPVYDPPTVTLDSVITVGRGFNYDFSADFDDVDRDPNKGFGMHFIAWGNTDPEARYEGDIGNWINHGLVDEFGDAIHPIQEFTPGNGKILFSHTYNAQPSGPLTISYQGGVPGQSFASTVQASILVQDVTQVSTQLLSPDDGVQPDLPFPLTYRLTNQLPQTGAGLSASNVVLNLALPAGMSVNTAGTPCSLSGPARVQCTVAAMAPGEVVDITLAATISLAAARSQQLYQIDVQQFDDGPRLTQDTDLTSIVLISDRDIDGVIDADDAFPLIAAYSQDTDGDGMADAWEREFGLDPLDAADALLDPDGDGIVNLDEFRIGNAPLLADIDSLVGSNQRLFAQTAVDDRFGFNVQSGDVNGDGFSDVIVGAPHLGASGSVFVGYGSTEGVGPLTEIPSPGFSEFGRALDVNDYDGNGYADIAVSGVGGFALYMNSVTGITPAPVVFNGTPGLGVTLESGDLDGDRLPDLLVADKTANSGAGRVYLYRARNEYWINTFAHTQINSNTAGLGMGDAISVADIDGDNEPDLMIGAAFHTNPRVLVYLGVDNDWVNQPAPALSFTLDDPNISGSRFGFSMSAAGDVDGDDIDDLLVGAYRAQSTGEAYLYLSDNQYWLPGNQVPSQTLAGTEAGGQFGVRVALLPDAGPDHFADAAIGANLTETDGQTDQGSFVTFRGSPTGLTALTTRNGDNRQMLGYFVADAGDIDGDGRSDLIVGAPEIASASHVADGGYADVLVAGGIPQEPDDDGDKVGAALDNCAAVENTDQADLDGDGAGNVCDDDADGDGMPAQWENQYGLDDLNPADAGGDADGDGLSNLQEFDLGTDPRDRDTDNDGLADGDEVARGLNPLDRNDCPEELCPTSSNVLKIIITTLRDRD